MQALPNWTVDDFTSRLSKLSIIRRQAALFALEADMKPEAVIQLNWADVLKMQPASMVAIDILLERNRVRHIRLSYVFWEFVSEQIAAPLLHLQSTAVQAFGMPWEQIQYMHATMLMVSTSAESRAFQDSMRQHLRAI